MGYISEEKRILTIYYKETGDKEAPLMVFIHGGGVSGWMWDKQIEYFSNYHCLIPDMVEQGGNDTDNRFSINFCAEKIIELVEEKGKDKPIIVIGFSLGAQVLTAMLSIKPNLIDYAIINSALVKPIPFAKLLLNSLNVTYPLVKIKSFSRIQARSMYIDEDYFETYYQESNKMSSDTFVRIMEENMTFTLPEHYKKATGKILITVGEKERKVMKDSFFELLNSNPNSEGVIFPKIGHGVSLAQPELFNKLIESWIVHERVPNQFQVYRSSMII